MKKIKNSKARKYSVSVAYGWVCQHVDGANCKMLAIDFSSYLSNHMLRPDIAKGGELHVQLVRYVPKHLSGSLSNTVIPEIFAFLIFTCLIFVVIYYSQF